MISFGPARPYDLTGSSHDESDRNQEDGLVLATLGLLGSRRPSSLVPSWFHAEKDFLPATAQTTSFQRTVPEGTDSSRPGVVGRIKTERLHPTPEPLKGVGFRLDLL